MTIIVESILEDFRVFEKYSRNDANALPFRPLQLCVCVCVNVLECVVHVVVCAVSMYVCAYPAHLCCDPCVCVCAV